MGGYGDMGAYGGMGGMGGMSAPSGAIGDIGGMGTYGGMGGMGGMSAHLGAPMGGDMASIVPPMPSMDGGFGDSTVHGTSANTIRVFSEEEA